MDYLRRKSDGRYVVRVVVPERLHKIVGKKQFERAVGRDPRTAQKLAYPLIAEFQRTIAQAERQLELQGLADPARYKRRFTDAEIAHAHYAEELEIDERVRNYPDYHVDMSWSRSVRVAKLKQLAAGALPSDEAEALIGWAVDKFAEREGRAIVTETVEWHRIARLLALVQLEVIERETERDQGDFTGQPSFPILQQPIEIQEPEPGPVKLQDLFDAHFRELEIQGAGAEAKRRWQPVFDDLRSFLRKDDARRITPEKLGEWKENLMDRLKPKTIKDVYFAAVRAVFRSAVKAHKLPSNPAAELTIKVTKPKMPREKGFNDDEAIAVLKAATAYRSKVSDNPATQEHPQTEAAKQWVPWLCAYTGARISEMTQLRKEDVKVKDGIHYLRITSDAGSVKAGIYRDVPIHPDLIGRGFLAFVKAADNGPLFYRPNTGRTSATPWKTVSGRVGDWVRGLNLIDQRVPPNHGWRHRFKTQARELGIDARVADAIQGHAARTAGEDYGDVTLNAKSAAIARLPPYPVRREGET